VYSTPVAANGVLYIMNASQLFAIAAPPARGQARTMFRGTSALTGLTDGVLFCCGA